MTAPILDVQDLRVTFASTGAPVQAVRGISFTLDAGRALGVVGESGSGKSAVLLAALGLLPVTASVSGSVRFRGQELLGAGEKALRRIRGKEIGMIFQDPLTSLNPVLSVGEQIMEAVRAHSRLGKAHARRRAVELLKVVAIPGAEHRLRAYPHEFSGGMRQRVVIAIAMANNPGLLIADEPTTALDVTVQAQILELLAQLRETEGLATVLVTHDLGVVAGFADDVLVMYAGRVVEQAPVLDLFDQPRHPYTCGLFACVPQLQVDDAELNPIGGSPPPMWAPDGGCPYAPRCPLRIDICDQMIPPLVSTGANAAACHVTAPALQGTT